MKRTVLTILILALVPCLGQAQSSRSRGFVAEDLPAAPQLEYSSAWIAEEYSRRSELQTFMPGSSLPDIRSWDGLKNLSKNTKIRVVNGDLKKTKGRFIEANEQQLKFKADGKVVTLDREDIRMVSLRLGPSTGERILMGLLEGAIIGAFAYAEARMAEKQDCWYEGRGKAPSAREGYVAMGISAAGMGILAAYAKPQDVVIYFQQERTAATTETPNAFEQAPLEPGRLEGGNIFAPVTHEPEEVSRMVEE